MSGGIVKGFAVAAGTGLAVGFGGARKRRALSMNNFDDPTALNARLGRIEERLAEVETANRRAIEVAIDATLAPYVEKLRADMQADMHESLQKAMDTRLAAFEKSIDSMVATRMGALEKALID